MSQGHLTRVKYIYIYIDPWTVEQRAEGRSLVPMLTDYFWQPSNGPIRDTLIFATTPECQKLHILITYNTNLIDADRYLQGIVSVTVNVSPYL